MFNGFFLLSVKHKNDFKKIPCQFSADRIQAVIGEPFGEFHTSLITGRVECPSQYDTTQFRRFTHEYMYCVYTCRFHIKLYVFYFYPPKIRRNAGTDNF